MTHDMTYDGEDGYRYICHENSDSNVDIVVFFSERDGCSS